MLPRPDLRFRPGPSGIHLFDRKTGLNVLFDELRVPRALWARAPRQVSIALTNRCDLACSYCYAPKNRAALDVARVVSWLHDLDANGCLGVGFGGGEPTLYQHFTQVCEYAGKKTGLAVTFTTHAHRIDAALAAELQGNVHFVRVSMDGVGATYEALRGRPFVALRSRLEIIRTLAPFGINFVVNADTLPDLDDAIKLAAEVGAMEFLLLPEQRVRGLGGIDPRSLRALHDWIRRYPGPVPLTISEASSDGIPTVATAANEKGLRAYAHIDASGVLKRSSYDQQGILIGPEGVMQALCLLRTRREEECA